MSRPRVLVVEDNLPVRDLLQRALRKMGCEVETELDGRAVVRRARKVSPDLIILDWRLPGLDGPEILTRLRKTRGLERTPVIGISGYAFPEMRERALALGCRAFLEKPLSLSQIRETVTSILEPEPTEPTSAGH